MAEESNINDEQAQRAAVFLTTEHSALQGARSATIFEANGRVSLYLSTLSSALVALALVGQLGGLDTAFFAFGVVPLPTLLYLGTATFVRAIETGIEDMLYARRINRIRRFYIDVVPVTSDYIDAAEAGDDVVSSLRAGGYTPGRWQPLLTAAGMVAVVNSVVAGSFGGLLVAWLGVRTLPAVLGLGTMLFIVIGYIHWRYQNVLWARAG